MVAMTEVTFVYLIFGTEKQSSYPNTTEALWLFQTSDVFCAKQSNSIIKHSISGLFWTSETNKDQILSDKPKILQPLLFHLQCSGCLKRAVLICGPDSTQDTEWLGNI